MVRSGGEKERAPAGLGWFNAARIDLGGCDAELWFHEAAATQVLSCVEMAELPRSHGVGPQWHISIVDRHQNEPARPSAAQVNLARCAFGMLLEAEEDNHHPGAARHFWLPVDPTERVDCECKTTEVVVTEPDGYRWTNPTDGPCRGCELERTMIRAGRPPRPCSIHKGRSSAQISVPGGG
jgi:hypothetical protein